MAYAPRNTAKPQPAMNAWPDVVTRLVLIALLALTPVPAFAKSGAEVELQALFADWLDEEEIAGGVLLISTPDQRLIVTAGVSNTQTQTPVAPDTRFYAASTGKTMVAAAILTAVDEGRIALNDPIDGFLASLDGTDQLDRAGTVTIEHLLNHSSGLPEYLTDDFFDASFAAPTTRWSAADALAYAYDEPAIPSGDRFEYTNSNYVILGHVLETLDGSLAQSLQRWVFRRADMMSTTVGAPPNPGDEFAHGYDVDGEDVSELGWNSVLGDGPVITTVADLEAFARALFTSQRIISFGTRDDMVTSSRLEPYYGLGVGIDEDELGIWYGHSGGYDGFEADLRYYPEQDLVLAYLVNGNQLSDSDFLDAAADWHFDQ
ncbi:MAG: serine hydrolase domain-containing protein [Hyphomicrobiales bacterium]|jgi:D-alanyl-D-alanine carboxypeptidase